MEIVLCNCSLINTPAQHGLRSSGISDLAESDLYFAAICNLDALRANGQGEINPEVLAQFRHLSKYLVVFLPNGMES